VAPPTSIASALRAGGTVVGTFLQSPGSATAEVVARAGVDFTCVEAEHSGIGVETMQGLVAASSAAGAPALVRVRQNEPPEIAAALDAGAAGVLVPRVDSAEEARAAVAAGRFPPHGTRGLGPGRATRWGSAAAAYLDSAPDEIALGVQVESRAAVDDLDRILAVPGLDYVLVGPTDLALSYGVRPGDPSIEEIAGSVIERAEAAGVAGGMFVVTAEAANAWLDRGARIVIVGSDLGLLARAVEATFAAIRRRP
jgi:4-hydroxy-2-oxoheptanedioate aldolase